MTIEGATHESAHAERVLQRIRACIGEAGDWLPFDAYMQVAVCEVLGVLEGGDVLEIGAGSGRLAFDVLTAMAGSAALPARYLILEVSADLRERQQALLSTLPAALAARVQWLDQPPTQGWQGALLANEVLDALPVKAFRWQDGALLERGVAVDAEDRLCWRDAPAPLAMREEIERLRLDAGVGWPSGYVSEFCPQVAAWIAAVTASMSKGVALFIDYGLPRREYYHPQRMNGTLRCHYRHRAHADPFAHPGLEDITAWVDFTRVAEAADAADLGVLGYTTQAALLLGLGIESLVAGAVDEATRIRRASEARRLLMPEEMGETFKAIALGRNFDTPLTAFAPLDLRRML
jgi:SAM-dependent MidA family methyltransferase